MSVRVKKRRSTRRSRRPIQQNPLSKRAKLLGLGGVVAVGGVAAYMLTRPSGANEPPAPPPDLLGQKAAECAALQASLVQLRTQPTPDAAAMLRIEGQIATCLAEARELGLTIPPAAGHLSDADASFARMEGWFNEYKTTSEHDPLKRNNTRQSILAAGAALAATYSNAIEQSPDTQTTKLIAQSLVRAIGASIGRRICFWNGDRGCGTFGSNEDQPDAKAAQENSRVTVPLIAAYAQAVAKLGGPGRAMADADGARFLDAILRPCANLKVWIDGQFNHYRGTSWDDAYKRNSTRQSILSAGRELTACLQGVFGQASAFGSTASMRAVSALTLAAINSSIDRWTCFFMGQSGCGTFAVSEDQPDAKAAQELAIVTTPLMTLYAQMASALVARRDSTAFEPLITAKLRVCQTMKDFIDAQFNHYRGTSWDDALKRNNTRQSMLATGAALAACLQSTLAAALAARPGPSSTKLSGLGLLFIPVTMQSMAPTLRATLSASAQAAIAATPVPTVDVARMVRPIAALTASALDAAVTRKLCYLYDQAGCGRFGVNEDHGNDKADQEQTRVITPLVAVYKSTVLADPSNAQSETPMLRALLREVTSARDFINSQYASLRATDYIDGPKRTNIRGSMIQAGQRMVTALRDARPTTVAGKALLRPVAQQLLNDSRERENCYRSGKPGCDRLDDAGYGAAVFFSGGLYAAGGREDDRVGKANQEKAQIGDPLAALLADRANGLGDLGEVTGLSPMAWVGIGAVGLLAFGAYHSKSKPVRRNKRRRRTSRRLTA